MSVEEASFGDTEAIKASMQSWRQGDVAAWPAFSHAADLSNPNTEVSVAAQQERPQVKTANLRTSVDGIVILSQTCDVVASPSRKPFVEVCPLKKVEANVATAAWHGEEIGYAALPWLDPTAVADLSRVMTIEKGMLAGMTKMAGWSSDEEIRNFQACVARRYQRFAFPDDFNRGMAKFRDKVKSRHGKPTSADGRQLARVKQIRVEAIPSWQEETFDVEFYFILPASILPRLPQDLPESDGFKEAKKWLAERKRDSTQIAEYIDQIDDAQALSLLWQSLVDEWMGNVLGYKTFNDSSGFAVGEDDYTIRQYWNSSALDLDYLSGSGQAGI